MKDSNGEQGLGIGGFFCFLLASLSKRRGEVLGFDFSFRFSFFKLFAEVTYFLPYLASVVSPRHEGSSIFLGSNVMVLFYHIFGLFWWTHNMFG